MSSAGADGIHNRRSNLQNPVAAGFSSRQAAMKIAWLHLAGMVLQVAPVPCFEGKHGQDGPCHDGGTRRPARVSRNMGQTWNAQKLTDYHGWQTWICKHGKWQLRYLFHFDEEQLAKPPVSRKPGRQRLPGEGCVSTRRHSREAIRLCEVRKADKLWSVGGFDTALTWEAL